MQVEVEKTGPCACTVSVTVPAVQVDEQFEAVYRKVARAARIPGFRAGKAPRSIIEAHYNEQIQGEVESKLVESTLFKAMDDKNLSPVNMPRIITQDKLQRGVNYAYKAAVETQPEITLKAYKGLPIEAVQANASAEDVDNELNALRTQNAQMVPILDRDIAQRGDFVVVDYSGSLDGQPIEGGQADNAVIEVGGNEVLPALSNGLEGLKIGEQRDLAVDFPADYPATHLAGKIATFHVVVKELKKKDLPKLDDAFAEDLGEESLAALRDKITQRLNDNRKREADSTTRQNVLKALVEANPFDLPPSMVTSYAERMIQGAAARVQQMLGQKIQLSPEELAGLRASSEKDAELQVRGGLLLLEVSKAAEIAVQDTDIDAEVENIAIQSGEDAEIVRNYYSRNEARDQLRYKIAEDKAIKFLLDHASA